MKEGDTHTYQKKILQNIIQFFQRITHFSKSQSPQQRNNETTKRRNDNIKPSYETI